MRFLLDWSWSLHGSVSWCAGQSVKNKDAFQVLEQVFLHVSVWWGHCPKCQITQGHMGSHADHTGVTWVTFLKA